MVRVLVRNRHHHMYISRHAVPGHIPIRIRACDTDTVSSAQLHASERVRILVRVCWQESACVAYIFAIWQDAHIFTNEPFVQYIKDGIWEEGEGVVTSLSVDGDGELNVREQTALYLLLWCCRVANLRLRCVALAWFSNLVLKKEEHRDDGDHVHSHLACARWVVCPGSARYIFVYR